MRALLVVDVQNDFCPGGALPVPDGDAVVPVVNRLARHFDRVLLTQDWHPAGHLSFASSHAGRKPYETIELPYGRQILWPDHCVQGSAGAQFHPEIGVDHAELIIRKGFRREIDSYSAFVENDKSTPTGLGGYLDERGVTHLYLAGLATDFCVLWSVEDARRRNLEVTVVQDATRGIDIEGSVDRAWERIRAVGGEVVTSEELLVSARSGR